MPRVKAKSAPVAVSRPKVARPKTTKAASPKKKIKKVLVDVIADEPIELAAGFSGVGVELAEYPKEIAREFFQSKKTSPELPAEIDQQSKFYSRLASEIKNKKDQPVEKKEAGPKKNLSLYRRLVWKFIILTAILLAIVAYFSFSQLTVLITPKGEVITDTILLKVSALSVAAATATTTTPVASNDSTDPREPVTGSVQALNLTAQKVYPATGQQFGSEEIIGTVKVINNYIKSQALVATTRLLSPDNKLFRLKNAVNLPAGGQVVAEIYADKPSQDLAIGPTSFTIPGLWVGLQDKIYARSDAAFVFQQQIKTFVNPSDIQQATTDIKSLLLADAQAQTAKQGGDWLFDTSNQDVVSFSAKPGDQTASFTATATAKIMAISFSKEQAAKLALAKLNLLVPDDKTLTEFKPEEITYSLESYNPQDNSATVRASFTGTMMLKSDSTVINRSQLVNLTKEQIDNYLQNFPEIKTYQLRFFPSFIHKAPSLVDRIKIKINTSGSAN